MRIFFSVSWTAFPGKDIIGFWDLIGRIICRANRTGNVDLWQRALEKNCRSTSASGPEGTYSLDGYRMMRAANWRVWIWSFPFKAEGCRST